MNQYLRLPVIDTHGYHLSGSRDQGLQKNMEQIRKPRDNWKISVKLGKLWKFTHQKQFGRNVHSVPRVRIQKFELISNPALPCYVCFLHVIKEFKSADMWRQNEDVPGGTGEPECTCISNTGWINLVTLNLNLVISERKRSSS